MPSQSARPKSSRQARRNFSTNAHHVAVQENVDFILSSMRDPYNIRHCGPCLLGALFVLNPPAKKNGEALHPLPKIVKNHMFWNHLFSFLVMKRTNQQIDHLMTQLSHCRCNLRDKKIKSYHDASVKGPSIMNRTSLIHFGQVSGATQLLSAERCAVFVELFYLLHANLAVCGTKSVAKGEARNWPCTAADLAPYGPDDTIQSLLQWYMFIPDPAIFSLIGAIIRVCRFPIIPSAIKFQTSHFIVQSTRFIVEITMFGLAKPPTTPIQRNGRTYVPSPHSISTRFTFAARSFAEYLYELNTLPYDIVPSLLRGSETKILQLCSLMIYLSSDPRYQVKVPAELSEYYEYFSEYGQWLFRFYHMHLHPRPDMLVHPHIFKYDKRLFPPPSASRRSTDEDVINYIGSFRDDQRCSAYLCPNSLQSAGKAFQRCGRCNIVSYCSRDCQTKAWREEKYPHKRICPILRMLINAGGGPRNFYPVPNQPPLVPPEELAKVETYEELRPWILRKWKDANVSEGDLEYVQLWGKLHDSARAMPDGSECSPGYDDYEELLSELTEPLGPGPRPVYMDRLTKWPSEVEKEKEHLEAQPFWDEEIEC